MITEKITNAERVRTGQMQRSGELRIGHNGPNIDYRTDSEKDRDAALHSAIVDKNFTALNKINADKEKKKQERIENLRNQYKEDINKGKISKIGCTIILKKVNNLCNRITEEHDFPPMKTVGKYDEENRLYVITINSKQPIIWDAVCREIQRNVCKKELGEFCRTMNFTKGARSNGFSILVPFFEEKLYETIRKIVKNVLNELYKR